jgi:putative ABC transport system substrate-binding protein
VVPARSAEGQPSRLAALAAEVVALKPDLIVAVSLSAIQAARRASASVPIVGVVGPDPAEAEALERLALRDKNLTGVTRVAPALASRLMELLKEAEPRVARVAVLRPATPSTMAIGERDLRATARGLRVRVQTVVARRAAELETAFDEMARERFHAVIVSEHPALLPHRARIAELATSRGLLWVADLREFAEAGALLSYGPGTADLYRRAAAYADRILKGARPGDLAIESPSRHELVLNLGVAQKLDRAFPASLLTQADALLE